METKFQVLSLESFTFGDTLLPFPHFHRRLGFRYYYCLFGNRNLFCNQCLGRKEGMGRQPQRKSVKNTSEKIDQYPFLAFLVPVLPFY